MWCGWFVLLPFIQAALGLNDCQQSCKKVRTREGLLLLVADVMFLT